MIFSMTANVKCRSTVEQSQALYETNVAGRLVLIHSSCSWSLSTWALNYPLKHANCTISLQ